MSRKLIKTFGNLAWKLFSATALTLIICILIILVTANLWVKGWLLPASSPNQLQQLLERHTQLIVNYEAASVKWYGLFPDIYIQNLSITDNSDKLLLHSDLLLINLDPLETLSHLSPVLKQLHLYNARAQIETAQPGTTKNSELIQTLLLRSQHLSIQNLELSVKNFEQVPSSVFFSFIEIENHTDFHRFRIGKPDDAYTDMVIIELEGDSSKFKELSGKGYVSMTTEDIKQYSQFIDPKGTLNISHSNINIWIAIEENFDITYRGEAQLNLVLDPSIGSTIRAHTLVQGSYRFDGQQAGQALIELQQLQMQINNRQLPTASYSLSWADSILTIKSPDSLPLADLMQGLTSIPWLPQQAKKPLQELNLRGSIDNFQLTLDWSKPSLTTLIRGNLSEVSNNAYYNIPIISNLNGYFETSLKQGFIDINSRNIKVLYPSIYDKPMHYQRFQGRVYWHYRPQKKSVTVHSDSIHIQMYGSHLYGKFKIYTPWKLERPEHFSITDPPISSFELIAGLRDLASNQWPIFIPRIMAKTTKKYLQDSIRSMRVTTGSLVLRQSYNGKNSLSYGLMLNVEKGAMVILPKWPLVTQISARVIASNNKVDIQAPRAQIKDLQLYDFRVQLTPEKALNNSHILSIKGRGSGNSSNGLYILRETPLRAQIGNSLDNLELTGHLDTLIAIDMPLIKHSARPPHIDIKARLHNNQLQLKSPDLAIEALNGELHYVNNKLTAEQLSGQLWGKPLNASITTAEAYQINLSTRVEFARLKQKFNLYFLNFIDGETDVAGKILLPKLDNTNSKKTRLYQFTSHLQGLAIDLPANLNKNSEQERPLALQIRDDGVTQEYFIEYAGALKGQFSYSIDADQSRSLRSGVLQFNDTGKLEPKPGEFIARGSMKATSNQAIRKFIDNLTSAQEDTPHSQSDYPNGTIGGLKPRIDIDIDSLQFSEVYTVNQISSHITTSPRAWIINFNQDDLKGTLQLPFNEDPAKIHFKRLHILSDNISTKDKGKQALVTPPDLPELHVSIDSLKFDKIQLKDWKFQLYPLPTGIKVDSIVTPWFTEVEPDTRPTTLLWRYQNQKQSTQLNFNLALGDIAQPLSLFTDNSIISSKKASFKGALQWEGHPLSWDANTIKGPVSFTLKKGAFKEAPIATNIGFRLISLINVHTWLRRLSLDFSDIFEGGTAFDSIQGSISLEEGKASISDSIQAQTPAARLAIAGVANLVNNHIDGELLVSLPLRQNSVWVAGLLINLPAAIGTFIISKLLSKEIDKLTNVTYTIEGTLNNPKIKVKTIRKKRNKQSRLSPKTGQPFTTNPIQPLPLCDSCEIKKPSGAI